MNSGGIPQLASCETPSNPLMKITDLAGVARLAREANAISVCDRHFHNACIAAPARCLARQDTAHTLDLVVRFADLIGAIGGLDSEYRMACAMVSTWSSCFPLGTRRSSMNSRIQGAQSRCGSYTLPASMSGLFAAARAAARGASLGAINRIARHCRRNAGHPYPRPHSTLHYESSVTLDYLAEVNEQLLAPAETNERHFRLLIATLDYPRAGGNPFTAATYIALWAVRLAGFLPDLYVKRKT
jgi:hypothetical protein